MLKEGGRLITIRSEAKIDEEKMKAKKIEAFFHWMELDRDDLIEVVKLYGEGKIKAYFDAIYPLSELRRVHERSEAGRAP